MGICSSTDKETSSPGLGAAMSITVMLIVMLALLVYVRNATRSGVQHG